MGGLCPTHSINRRQRAKFTGPQLNSIETPRPGPSAQLSPGVPRPSAPTRSLPAPHFASPAIRPRTRPCKTDTMSRLSEPSPYVEFDRRQWRALRMSTPLALTEEELVGLRGLGEQIDLLEVEEVYLPLARLIHLQVAARQRLFAATAEFLGEPQQNPDRPVPFIIGVAGSVAVGKSTTARVLQALLARWDHHPRVDLVTTDGFLYPNAELQRRNLMHRKGFPESYNRRALMRFVTSVKSGSDYACAPVYSHLHYDIIPGQNKWSAIPTS